MNIIIWLIVGALAGWLASIIMKRDGSMGAVANIIVGIVGSFIGGFILKFFDKTVELGKLNFTSILTAVLGAVVLLAIINLVKRGSVR